MTSTVVRRDEVVKRGWTCETCGATDECAAPESEASVKDAFERHKLNNRRHVVNAWQIVREGRVKQS